MIKLFCDCCGDEIVENNSPRFSPGSTYLGRLCASVTSANRKTKLSVEVITSKDGVSNDGDFCKYCILDALVGLDDRPKVST